MMGQGEQSSGKGQASFARRAAEVEEELVTMYTPFNNEFRDFEAHERNRFPEYVYQAGKIFREGDRIINLGSGTNALDPLMQRLGMRSCIVDDFGDFGYDSFNLKGILEQVHGSLGIEVHNLDFLNNPLPFEDGSVDAVISIDSLEHWYRGVHGLMAEIRRVTRVGARMLIIVPNAAHLKHRVRAISGRSTWARFEDWYNPEPFRGHVREPTADDMQRLFELNDFRCDSLEGVNIHCLHRGAATWMRAADKVLRLRPTLCSHLAVLGTKVA